MYCTRCGALISDSDAFCSKCGSAVKRLSDTDAGGASVEADLAPGAKKEDSASWRIAKLSFSSLCVYVVFLFLVFLIGGSQVKRELAGWPFTVFVAISGANLGLRKLGVSDFPVAFHSVALFVYLVVAYGIHTIALMIANGPYELETLLTALGMEVVSAIVVYRLCGRLYIRRARRQHSKRAE